MLFCYWGCHWERRVKNLKKTKHVSLYTEGLKNPLVYAVPDEWDDRKTVSKMMEAYDTYSDTDEGVEMLLYGDYGDYSKMVRPEDIEETEKLNEVAGWLIFRLFMPDSFLEDVGIQVLGKKALKDTHVIHLTHDETYGIDRETRPMIVKTVGNYQIIQQFSLGTPDGHGSDSKEEIMYHRWDFELKYKKLNKNDYMRYNVLVIDRDKPHKFPDPETNELFATVEHAEAFIHGMQKYGFTGNKMEVKIPKHVESDEERWVTLYQIHALMDIPWTGVKAGEIGGWIESPSNLSYNAMCWVHKDVQVSGESVVRENAVVSGQTRIRGSSFIEGNTKVMGHCTLDNTNAKGNITLKSSKIQETEILDDVHIESTDLYGAIIFGNPLPSSKAGVILKHCTFSQNKENLKIENKDKKELKLENVSMVFENEEWRPTISGWGFLTNIIGESVHGLDLRSQLLIRNVKLVGNTKLNTHSDSEILMMQGSTKKEPIVLEEGNFYLGNSEITGQVHLKGDVQAESLTASDFSFIENQTDELFELEEVNMEEMATLTKQEEGQTAINLSLSGESALSLG